ncbi:MAG: YkgJ family cysteine cluster protein [Candidatus Bathyarchaeia archaeon]
MPTTNRQENFFHVCGTCPIRCCQNARPPITKERKRIIEKYLQENGISIPNPFMQADYVFPREDEEGYCVFHEKETKKCIIHPVKPETCVAGPITFDVNPKTGKIEWYLKMEKICPLAGKLYRNTKMLETHLKSAKKEILRLIRQLDAKALNAILKIEEPETFKIDETEI